MPPFDGSTVVTLVCTAFGALISFIASLLLYRFKQIESALDKMRAEMHTENAEVKTLVAALQGKTDLMTDRATEWRERALERFITKGDAQSSFGDKIAAAIAEHARTITAIKKTI